MVKKPAWFLEKNPAGTLPVLEHDDGRVLYESLIVSDYLDAMYADNQLNPADPYVKAKHSLTVEMFSRVTAAYQKVLRANTPESLNDLNKSYEYFEKYLVTDYFGGSNSIIGVVHSFETKLTNFN
jgi:glutathione S-transferase